VIEKASERREKWKGKQKYGEKEEENGKERNRYGEK